MWHIHSYRKSLDLFCRLPFRYYVVYGNVHVKYKQLSDVFYVPYT